MNQKIKMVKISDCENPIHANHIKEGKEVIGTINAEPTVGRNFFIQKIDGISFFRTSTVTEIVDRDTFKTCNSIYKILERETIAD